MLEITRWLQRRNFNSIHSVRAAVAGGESSLLGKVANMTGAISAVDKGLDAISPAVYFCYYYV
jgi:hypothetical protein